MNFKSLSKDAIYGMATYKESLKNIPYGLSMWILYPFYMIYHDTAVIEKAIKNGKLSKVY
jgi:hypothetical protein